MLIVIWPFLIDWYHIRISCVQNVGVISSLVTSSETSWRRLSILLALRSSTSSSSSTCWPRSWTKRLNTFHGRRSRRRIVANLFEIPFPRRSANNGENEKKKKDGEKPNRTHSWVSQNAQLILAHAILLQVNHHQDLVTSDLLQVPV